MMNQLKSILKSLFVSLALVIGGIGTAAATGNVDSADADTTADQGLSVLDQRGSEDTFVAYGSDDEDEDEGDDDNGDNW